MPLQQTPQFKATPLQSMELPQPGIGGLNLKDLEFEQEVNQSPYMLNMMYRNGAFGKRYGQELMQAEDGDVDFEDTIYSVTSFGGYIIVHAGTKMYKYQEGSDPVQTGTGFPESEGIFIIYAQELFYLCSNGFFKYSGSSWSQITAYIPDLVVNCRPDGSSQNDSGTAQDELNLLSRKFSFLYNGDGTSTKYIYDTYDNDYIDDTDPENDIFVYVDDFDTPLVYDSTLTENNSWRESTVTQDDETHKCIEFQTAPTNGDINVRITFTMKETILQDELAQLLSCKYHDTFGGTNNSRLFLAGCGRSKYFWSDAYDISNFPESNWAILGNTEEDITGFGRQYNVLLVFKPREMYSISAYVQTSATTLVEKDIGTEGFRSQLVNPRIGCDAPDSIQLINNLLTWFNSKEGVCTLVSTNIQDERNVRIISRNIERTNNLGVKGILDIDEDPATIQSIDYNNRYFLVFPESGYCFMWDYEISPYRFSASGETPPRSLDWYLFDHFHVKQFMKFDKRLLYASSHEDFDHSLVRLTASFFDLDFDNDGMPDSIEAYYMTPFLQFNAVEYLKTVKNLYIQCRGDTASKIDIYYYTDENGEPEQDAESIQIGGRLWKSFAWETFMWTINSWAITYRRKCSLKKIQMASFYFYNNEFGRDMSITHISLQYQIVKNIK